MYKTLASYLTSLQQFLACLLLSPTSPEDQNLQEFTCHYFKQHSHLPVQAQITCVLEDSFENYLHYLYREHTPLVPCHKALPQTVPYTQPLPHKPHVKHSTPVPRPTALPSIPLECCISATPLLAFTHIHTSDNLAIAESKVHAMLKCLQAIFDQKALLKDLPHNHCLAIQHIGDKLKWISNNISHNSASWTCAQQQSVE